MRTADSEGASKRRRVTFAAGTPLEDGDSAARLHRRARQLSIKRLAEEEAGCELFCVCLKPDDGTMMVGCDGCDEWFHPVCVGISRRAAQVHRSHQCCVPMLHNL